MERSPLEGAGNSLLPGDLVMPEALLLKQKQK